MKAKRQRVNLKAVKKRFPDCAAHLDLFESIQDTVYSVKFRPPPRLGREEVQDALGSGRTVLDTCVDKLDTEAFGRALGKLFKHLADRNAREFSRASRTAVPEGLMADYLHAREKRLERHASQQGLSAASLVSCCQQAARPQLAALRDANGEADLSVWHQGHCPFCGALPAMAQVDAQGSRHLFCPNCLAQYRFARHHCPGCGHAGLNVLTMEAWPGLLLESCQACGTYLKTWSAGAGDPPCPFPHLDILTRGVDEAAEPQELKRLSLSVMGV